MEGGSGEEGEREGAFDQEREETRRTEADEVAPLVERRSLFGRKENKNPHPANSTHSPPAPLPRPSHPTPAHHRNTKLRSECVQAA